MGLTLAGSGIFGIIYSSVSCWAALFSYCILGRRLVPLQVLGMAVVVAGLVVSSLENDFASDGGRRVAAGSVAIAVGTVAYGLEYALCERLLSASDAAGETPVASATDERDAAEPRRASGNEAIVEMMYYMGLWGLGLSALYTAVVVAPRWDYPSRRPSASRRGARYLTALVVSHTFSNWLHNLSWFIICDREGSVATGLLQGLKAVLLFGGSSLAFCDRQESQCMTRPKKHLRQFKAPVMAREAERHDKPGAARVFLNLRIARTPLIDSGSKVEHKRKRLWTTTATITEEWRVIALIKIALTDRCASGN
ncbi:hypothetical protein JL722_14876 [Aureococcus anophagefferens]|nr:hypothetical protein JL722_14876 [Aureococcus anophagefferens]